MKTEGTLFNTLYRASFKNRPVSGWKSNVAMRHALENARRFVLDDSMGRFMAELSNVPFIKNGMDHPMAIKIADSLRVSARLPHDAIWIEYPLKVYQRRQVELRTGETLNEFDESDIPAREGWLIQQHPAIPTACIMHVFTQDDHFHEDGFNVWTFPFAYAWCNDDSVLPWRSVLGSAPAEEGGALHIVPSQYITGIPKFERDNINCVLSPLIDPPWKYNKEQCRELLVEWAGVVRRVWALLATIDHLPVVHTEVRTSKGFLGKGQIRKYLAHHTITLNVPAKADTRVLARKAIAGVHRRRHEVRGHWRNDWRNVPSNACNPHLWECADENADLIECSVCHGRQIYIHKHERGDAGVGYVLHDYLLKHEAP